MQEIPAPVWWNGRHDRLKICCQRWRAGSSPATGTKYVKKPNAKAFGFFTLYVWMELLVVVIELTAYSLYFKKKGNIKRWAAPVYTLSANAASFLWD